MHRALPLAVLPLVFAAQAAVAIWIIPPWQNPDEPQHVMFSTVLAVRGVEILPDVHDERIETSILESMARHDWWRFYDRETPHPLPRSFAGVESIDVQTVHGPALYYIAASTLLKVAATRDPTTNLYVLRAVSAVLSVGTVLCIFLATRLFLGDVAALTMAFLVAVHPQFVISATTASPDAAISLAGALIWWQVGRIWAGEPALLPAVVMWAAAAVAAAAARVAMPVLLTVGAISAWYLAHRFGRRALVAACVVAAVALALTWIVLPERAAAAAGRILAYAVRPVQLAAAGSREWVDGSSLGFWTRFVDSFWMSAGWMRFQPPIIIRAATWIVAAVGFAGVALCWWRHPELRRRIVLAAAFVAAQLAAVFVVFFLNAVGAQGRYLFPVLGPLACLFWLGVREWRQDLPEGRLAAFLVVCGAVFNLLAWRTVLLPAYA
jgi:hypothetical protein